MSIRINEGAGGAYDSTEEGKRALKIIIPGIIILVIITGSIEGNIDSPITELLSSLPMIAIVGAIIYLYKNRDRFFVRVDIPRQGIKAPGKQILNPQQSNFNQTNIKNIPLGTQFANPTQDHMKQQLDLPITYHHRWAIPKGFTKSKTPNIF